MSRSEIARQRYPWVYGSRDIGATDTALRVPAFRVSLSILRTLIHLISMTGEKASDKEARLHKVLVENNCWQMHLAVVVYQAASFRC